MTELADACTSASLCLNMEPRRVSASVAFAYLCPSEGAVVGFPVRGAEAVAAFGGLRVNLQGEAWVFVSELVGGVADVVAAGSAGLRTCGGVRGR